MKKLIKKMVREITGIPSSHIDWMWKLNLLSFQNKVGKAHRLEYTTGMVFEICLIENLKNAGIPYWKIQLIVRFIYDYFTGQHTNNGFRPPFNPYLGEQDPNSCSDVDLVVQDKQVYLIQVYPEHKNILRKAEIIKNPDGKGETLVHRNFLTYLQSGPRFTMKNPMLIQIRLSAISLEGV